MAEDLMARLAGLPVGALPPGYVEAVTEHEDASENVAAAWGRLQAEYDRSGTFATCQDAVLTYVAALVWRVLLAPVPDVSAELHEQAAACGVTT